ncbi:hypothetical protein KAR91_25825 [Candidatus Pacearchaeota archaeon]|nr:hypothetical protein [Candidatus Pacearchaeota archaeon]
MDGLAQINIPQKTDWQNIEDTVLMLDTFNFSNVGNVENDSIMFENTEYPFFINQNLVDSVWKELAYNDTIIDGVKYIPSRRPIFYNLRSGNTILGQKSGRQIQINIDHSHGLQIWWGIKKAKDLGATPDQLWSHPDIDTILNWDVYFPRDTVILDTIN